MSDNATSLVIGMSIVYGVCTLMSLFFRWVNWSIDKKCDGTPSENKKNAIKVLLTPLWPITIIWVIAKEIKAFVQDIFNGA